MRTTVVALAIAAALALPAGTAAADPSPAPATTDPAAGGPWTIAELPPVRGDGALVHAVAAGPDGLVAIGPRVTRAAGDDAYRAWGAAWTSPDGIAWTPVDAQGSGLDLGWYRPVLSGPEVGLVGVASGPGGFVVVGRIGPARLAAQEIAIWRSADGRSWERVTTDAFPAGSRPMTLVGSATGYLAGGVIYGSRAPHGAIWTSPDGNGWTRATAAEGFGIGGYIDTMEDPGSGGIRSIAPYGDGAIATGLACFPSFDERSRFAWSGGCWGAAWRSDDRVAWVASEVPQTHGDIRHVAALGDRVVAAVEICSGCPPAILVSDDGTRWDFAYGAPVGGELVSLVAAADGFRALLRAEGGGLAVWASADGTGWTPMAPLPDLPGDITWVRDAAMTVFGDRLVIVASTEGDTFRSFAIMGPAAD